MSLTCRKITLIIALFTTLPGCFSNDSGPLDKFNIGINDIDQDNDGLIEISSLKQLDWIRNDL